ncbi:MAG TPA: DUF3795 domain-containing protein [Prolixibacteraceae bacterium]|nr:DUF3795 domain-containing protein [Prolixibacteraceae bacterium]
MTSPFTRRSFLKQSAFAGFTGCALLLASRFHPAFAGFSDTGEDGVPDPAKLNYCGYQCPADCLFLKATRENDTSLKKKVYTDWQIGERYGADFDPEKIFCWGCKTSDKVPGIVVEKCTVRQCTLEKEHQCCIECNELKSCNKDLWQRFPEFYQSVIRMQEKYLSTPKGS